LPQDWPAAFPEQDHPVPVAPVGDEGAKVVARPRARRWQTRAVAPSEIRVGDARFLLSLPGFFFPFFFLLFFPSREPQQCRVLSPAAGLEDRRRRSRRAGAAAPKMQPTVCGRERQAQLSRPQQSGFFIVVRSPAIVSAKWKRTANVGRGPRRRLTVKPDVAFSGEIAASNTTPRTSSSLKGEAAGNGQSRAAVMRHRNALPRQP